jgi:hypothetical protein
MRYLAILLLAPWLLVLVGLYWAYPKSIARTSTRRTFDVVALAVVAFVTVEFAMLGFDQAALPGENDLGHMSGAIWQQVLPALYGYAAFSVALLLALLIRHLIWRRPR